jgi:peptide/nickel transport system ATP-binding protein
MREEMQGMANAGAGGLPVKAASSRPVLSVRDLRTHFFSREGELKAINGVSFDLARKEVLGIAGESGCGKSVTAQSILRILPDNGKTVSGEILLDLDSEVVDLVQQDPDGKRMRDIRGKEISMIFQEPMTSFCPVYTIGNQITEVIQLHQHCGPKEARQLSIEILQSVGMPNPSRVIDDYPFNLSGGMRQRAMVAMALSCRPRILIADEPTTAVDVTIQAQVLELIRSIHEQYNMSIIMITHDLGVIAELAQRVIIMYLGEIVERGSVLQVFTDPRHPYTEGLLASVPKLRKGRQTIVPISGTVPSLYEAVQGCKFHTRCTHYMPGTCDASPPAIEVDAGHHVRCFLWGGG